MQYFALSYHVADCSYVIIVCLTNTKQLFLPFFKIYSGREMTTLSCYLNTFQLCNNSHNWWPGAAGGRAASVLLSPSLKCYSLLPFFWRCTLIEIFKDFSHACRTPLKERLILLGFSWLINVPLSLCFMKLSFSPIKSFDVSVLNFHLFHCSLQGSRLTFTF